MWLQVIPSRRAPAHPRFHVEGLEPRLLLQAVQPAGLNPDRFEPNDSIATATNFGVTGSRLERDLSLQVPAPDNDYYRLFTPDAGPLTIQVVFFHAQGDVDAQLLNAAGAVLTTSAGASDSETIAWPAARKTVYYLHVYGYNGAANPNYELTINGPSIPADRFEPNDDYAHATDLGLSTDRTISDLTVHFPGNQDIYRLTAGGTGTLNVSMALTDSLGDLDLQLQDGFGNVLASSTSAGNGESVSAPVTALATYYVRVFGYQNATSPDYALTVDGPDVAPDRYEPNDTFATATNFGTLGSRIENNLSIHAPGNEDFFRFNAGRSGPLNVTVSFTHALGDIDIQLLDGSGAVLTSSGGAGNTETINWPMGAGQDYTLRVYGYGGAVNPHYDLAITGPAPLLDRFERNDDFAHATNLGTTADRTVNLLTFDTLQDRDFFRMTPPVNGFLPPPSGTLQVTAASTTTAGGLLVYLYDGFGNPLVIGVGSVSFTVTGGQIYYVQVVADNFTVDLYEMTINGPDIAPDRYEPNDTLAAARDVGPMGFWQASQLNIHAPGNDDYFRFTGGVPGANPLSVFLNFTHDAGDLDLQLLDSSGATLATSSTQGDGEIINAFIVGGQTYYLRVYGTSIYSSDIGPAMNGLYSLIVNGPNFPPDVYEPNDNEPNATNLGTAGDHTVTNLSLHSHDDHDYFRVTVPADGVLQATATSSTASGSLTVFLRDAAGTQIAFGGSAASAPVVAGKVYYVQVFSSDTAQSYKLIIHGPAVPPDRYEPNDALATARDLGPMGHREVWDLTIHASGNEDFFRFTGGVPGSQPLSINLTFSNALGDLDLMLLDAAGTQLAISSHNTDSETINTSVVGGQTYYIRVRPSFDAVNPNYELVINGPNFPPDRFEPNDNYAFATNLGTVVHRAENQLSIHAPGEADFFRLTAAANGVLQATATTTTTPGTLYVSLKDAFGNEIGFGYGTASVPVVAGQVYYVMISADGFTVPSYNLTIDGPNFPADRFEPNDTRAAATELGLLGDRLENNLSLHAPGNDDFYRVTAAAAGLLNVTLIFDHLQGDVDVELQDPAGTVLVASTGASSSEAISRAVTAGETFYVRVYGYQRAVNPNYTMIIDGPDARGPAVVGRNVFYNRSALDGNDAAANAFDDRAIAWDKAALLPGRAAGFINVSNYSRGINGLMIDLAGLRSSGGITAADVVLEVGDGTTWSRAPRARAFAVRAGAGTGGSDRISIVFDDNAIQNTWLRATVLANDRTGLSSPDVFCCGNLIGDTGNPGPPAVNVTDLDRARAAVATTDAALIKQYDFNRDGRIDARDVLIVRNNQRQMLPLFAAPAIAGMRTAGPVPAPSLTRTARPPRRGVLDEADFGLLV